MFILNRLKIPKCRCYFLDLIENSGTDTLLRIVRQSTLKTSTNAIRPLKYSNCTCNKATIYIFCTPIILIEISFFRSTVLFRIIKSRQDCFTSVDTIRILCDTELV